MADRINESQLCERYAAAAKRLGWSVYAEVSGWDLLLVAGPNALRFPNSRYIYRAGDNTAPAGYQVGVEAKLSGSVTQLRQIIERMQHDRRPDSALALVANAPSRDFRFLAAQVGYSVVWLGDDRSEVGVPMLARSRGQRERRGPIRIPEFPTDLSAAGTPSPRVLTGWRVAALRVCHRLLTDPEPITRAAIKALGCDPGIWVDRRWIEHVGKRGRKHIYALRREANGSLPKGFPLIGWEAEYERVNGAEVANER